MKVKNILVFNDNELMLKNKKKEIIIEKINKGIIAYGKIINVDKFIKSFDKVLNKHKLNNNLFGETIKILVNPTYSLTDIIVLKNIFLGFNYRKVYVEYINKYYKLNQNNAYLNVFENYQLLTYQDEYKKTNNVLIPSYLFHTNSDLMKFIKYHINNRELYILGDGNTKEEIFNQFESVFLNKTYTFCDSKTYLIIRAN